MHLFDWLLALFCAIAVAIQLLSALLAGFRCSPLFGLSRPARGFAQPVTILRPLRGVDTHDELTLRSGFTLDYPDYELIFCCEDANDPALTLVRDLIAAHPEIPARVLIGRDKTTANPKLNNVIKGWEAARHDWIILADCNVLMPSDYIQRLLQGWREDTGVLCSPPVGCMPKGIWAEIECAFLNTYQLRWQYAADSVGLGFAQGKTMLWRRSQLEQAGGIRALGEEIAEDAAATKIVRRQRLRVRLVDRPFGQPLGHRSRAQVWSRQLRWARLRRATFPTVFIPELLSSSLLPMLAGVYAADQAGLSPTFALLILMVLWFGSEAALARVSGWHLTLTSPVAWAVRDLMLPFLWIAAWSGDSFSWRGNEIPLTRTTEA
ncbi:ceramide glucosyltransferase [Rhodomicrobium sp. Az07]|uniref:ceramide glucosyltransferase n=1 Tax=Rhodomicrobium sp. Az07 TaxID=2839034 RepID=UPI001BEC21D0|nr:ceramide glucosyltransferase [Rhodomicrobium sp. Az07]